MFEQPNGSRKIQPRLLAETAAELLPNLQDLPIKSSPRKQAAILVLGVHRSGTSSLANLINVLGATLPEQVLGPGFGNPLGHWEPTRLMEINEEILSAIGRSWHDPRPIPRSWFRSKTAYTFHERIAEVITSGYGDEPLILIKDPRICRLVPLYLDVLDALGIEPLVILIVRHPWEVIRSLHGRDQIDPLTIEHLWLRNFLEAEEATRTCKRVWTSFEQLLVDWQSAAQSIAHGLGTVWPNGLETVAAEGANILRPRQRHYKIADDPAFAPLGPLTMRTWQGAQQALNGKELAAKEIFDEIRAAMTEVDRLSAPQRERIEREKEEALRQLQTVEIAHRSEIARLSAEVQERVDELQGRVTQISEDREGLRRQIDSIHASICWRLTWPMRWLHRQATRLRGKRQSSDLVL